MNRMIIILLFVLISIQIVYSDSLQIESNSELYLKHCQKLEYIADIEYNTFDEEFKRTNALDDNETLYFILDITGYNHLRFKYSTLWKTKECYKKIIITFTRHKNN